MNTIKQMSKWAQIHVWQARLVIMVCYALLFGLVYIGSRLLLGMGIIIPEGWLYAGFCVAIMTYFIHELLYDRVFILRRFIFQKVSCMAVLSASFFGLLVLFNQPSNLLPFENKIHAALYIDSTTAVAPVSTEANRARDLSPGGQAALTALVIFGTVVLIIGIAVLSCLILCAGGGILALLVLAGGTTGVILLAVHLIRRIHGKSRRRKSWRS